MTARATDLADLPDWPRWLSADEAATYVGVSVNFFRKEVAAGLWPKPIARGSRLTWDRKAIDLKSDLISGFNPAGMGDTILVERARAHGNRENGRALPDRA